MSDWVQIAQTSECPIGACLELVAKDRIVALFNVSGTVYALDGICPHQGGPLGKGQLVGCTLTCPWHGWQFNVSTGEHLLSGTIKQPMIPVKVEGDAIWVQLN